MNYKAMTDTELLAAWEKAYINSMFYSAAERNWSQETNARKSADEIYYEVMREMRARGYNHLGEKVS